MRGSSGERLKGTILLASQWSVLIGPCLCYYAWHEYHAALPPLWFGGVMGDWSYSIC